MAADRWIAFAILAVLALPAAVSAAELPSQNKKPKPPETVKHCNVAGSPGVLAANGVCMKLSGYISAGFGAGHLK
ncbi:MAG TPA: hypothetical protein VJY34_19240 [Roseiarcus sp.]|nr:hypothetical protein [Roseiarcus sp.]